MLDHLSFPAERHDSVARGREPNFGMQYPAPTKLDPLPSQRLTALLAGDDKLGW
jgi:hypothetical protein